MSECEVDEVQEIQVELQARKDEEGSNDVARHKDVERESIEVQHDKADDRQGNAYYEDKVLRDILHHLHSLEDVLREDKKLREDALLPDSFADNLARGKQQERVVEDQSDTC